MEKEFTLEITNKMIYGVITTFAIIVLGIAVYAYTQSIPNPGHGANTIWISVNGTEKTLQQAINDGDLNKRGSNIAISKGELTCTGVTCGVVAMPVFKDGTNAKPSQCVWTITPITSPKIFIGAEGNQYERLHYTVIPKDNTTLEIKAGISDTAGNINCPSEFWIPAEESLKCLDNVHKIQYMTVCKK